MDIAFTKTTLRKNLLAKRQSLKASDVEEKSRIITSKVLEFIDAQSIKNIHIYSPLNIWNEVDTKELKDVIHRKWPHIEIVSPAPSRKQPLPKELFDLIIVPVLGFDKDNYRLGYGGGWYDRFLASQTQARTIGLAYSFAKIDNLPHEPHDIPLQQIVTEVGIID